MPITKIAEYTIKEDALEAVIAAIGKFVAAIREHEPNTFYEAYRKGESFEFVHLMKFTDEVAEEKHAGASYTKEFVDVLYPNCEKPPVFTDLTLVK